MPSEMKMGTINPFKEEHWHILQYYGGKLHFLLHFQYEGGTEKQIFTKYHSCKQGTNIQHIPILFTCDIQILQFDLMTLLMATSQVPSLELCA